MSASSSSSAPIAISTKSGLNIAKAEVVVPVVSKAMAVTKLLRSHIFMIRKGVVSHDGRLLTRVLRQLTCVRRDLDYNVVKSIVKHTLKDNDTYDILVQAESSSMSDSSAVVEDLSLPIVAVASSSSSAAAAPRLDADGVVIPLSAAAIKRTADSEESQRKESELLAAIVPEVDVYIQLVAASFLNDRGCKSESASLLAKLVTALGTYNRRSMDPLSAKIYSSYANVMESLGKDVEIRSLLLVAHRTACLQHNESAQASLSVCLLRSYLSHHLYTQADTFRLKSVFPDQRSNAQTARYCYYIGKIQAVQLHYSDAFASLTQALRKAPQQAAVGFRQVCTKLIILVQLLMGDIPDRALFTPADLKKSLAPYLQLTQAVRVGDLKLFEDTMMGKQKEGFEKDGIYSLIVRLRSNVIKAGLRQLNLAYSKISLVDVCRKLRLSNVDDGEYMVCKSIHDGVIEAIVDRDLGFIYSAPVADVYATSEPQVAYHKRIQFTLDIHAAAVKSLRYPEASSKSRQHMWESDDEDDEDNITGNAPDKREEEKKKDDDK